MAIVSVTPTKWTCSRDRDGHRTYKVTFKVITDDPADGPATVLQADDLPSPGDPYSFDNDEDLYATCKQDMDITQKDNIEGEPGYVWEVVATFTTQYDEKRCKDVAIEDPLLIPDRISGGSSRFQESAQYDRFGDPITNSAFEPLEGPASEWDKTRGTVKIVQNRLLLELGLLESLRDAVNDQPLWGLPSRCIKLSTTSWDRKFYGQCFYYFERTLEFEINTETFDRTFQDQGTKFLNGHWDTSGTVAGGQWVVDPIAPGIPADPTNPAHFRAAIGRDGKSGKWLLDGGGLPAGVSIRNGATTETNYYLSLVDQNESNPIHTPSEWLRIAGNLEPESWDAETTYIQGNLVYDNNDPINVYALISSTSVIGVAPSPATSGPGGPWLLIPDFNSDGMDFVLEWDTSLAYPIYRIVKFVHDVGTGSSTGGNIHGPGEIFVSKYKSGNFLLLGIPTDLEIFGV